MTIDECLAFVREKTTPGDWSVQTYGAIRHTRTGECPICFVGSELEKNPHGYKECARIVGYELGMAQSDIDTIAHGADFYESPNRGTVRSACHLPE